MKLLIAGAAGYLGEHVVRAAVAAGHDVTVLVRATARQPMPAGITRRDGDLTDVAFLARSLAGMEGVIFTAGRNWQPRLPMAEYQRQNVAPVAAFFAALADAAPTARVVFTSSMSAVAGSPEAHPFTEDNDRTRVCTARLSPYDRAKIECERLARAAQCAGRNVVILNPGYMLGPGATAESGITTTFLVRWHCLRKLPGYVNAGGGSYCDVRDVATAHVAALRRTPVNRYLLGGDNRTTQALHRRLACLTGVPCPRAVSPALAYTFQALVDGLAALTVGLWTSEVHRDFVRSLPLYYWADSSLAERDLGYHRRSLDETLCDTVADFVARGLLPEELGFVTAMTDATRPGLLLLRQLADRHLHRKYLLPRLGRIHAAAQHNEELSAALANVLAASTFDPDRVRYSIPWRQRAELRKLRDLLDYVYYASDAFHRRVS